MLSCFYKRHCFFSFFFVFAIYHATKYTKEAAPNKPICIFTKYPSSELESFYLRKVDVVC